MQIVLKSTPPHLPSTSISLLILQWSCTVPGRENTPWRLSTRTLSPAAPCPAPSLSFSPLCPIVPCTLQPPSAKGFSTCCSFSMGHSSLNCHTVTPIPSSRATFSEKPYLTSVTPLAQALSTPFVSLSLPTAMNTIHLMYEWCLAPLKILRFMKVDFYSSFISKHSVKIIVDIQ